MMANIVNTEDIIKNSDTEENTTEVDINNKGEFKPIFQNVTCVIVSFIYLEKLKNGNVVETPLHISYMTDHLNVKINQDQEQRKCAELISMKHRDAGEIDPVIFSLMGFLESHEIHAMEINIIFNNDIDTKISIYKELTNQTYDDRIMFTYDGTGDLNRLIFYTKYRVPEAVKIIEKIKNEKEKIDESNKNKI